MTALTSPPPVQFGAKKVGRVQLPAQAASGSALGLDIYRLTGTPADRAFLQAGDRLIKQQKAAPTERTMVPHLPNVDWENHFELAEEGFALAEQLFDEYQAGRAARAPEVLVAVRADTREIAGFELADIERTLADGSPVYTPLGADSSLEKIKNGTANHGSINWLFTLTPLKGVGQALSSLLRFPKAVQQIDVVAEHPDYTPQALPMYEKLGFQALSGMADQKPIPRKAETPNGDIPTFQAIHGIPMTTSRATYDRQAARIREAMQFQPAQGEKDYDLGENAFPSYPAEASGEKRAQGA